ncbi:MAG TPA: Gfo/Idh/MocA family oxidoreductase [Armatimonadetes bacterium]|nr:Gfo/Idh/MocA family oxidoreductase [Armatimonadota bacterium]
MPVRIGFIGTGGIARAHQRCLSQIAAVQMVAFCDVVEERARKAAEEHGGRAYTDFHRMLETEELDAVYICLPPFAHGQPELAAVEQGLALFIEKPVAIDLETACQIQEAIEQTGVICSVGYHWRYFDTTDRARELLADRTIAMTLGYWMGGMPGVPWWRVLAQSGGQMVEQTTHIVDLGRYLAGEVTEVYAAYATRRLHEVPNFEVSDVGVATLKYRSGAVGMVSNTCSLNGIGYTVGLHVVADGFVVEINGGRLRVIRKGDGEEKEPQENPKLREDRVFVEAIQKGDPSAIRSSYADAVKTLAVTLAANESAQTGRPVTLSRHQC